MIIEEYIKVKTSNKNVSLYRDIMKDSGIKSGDIIIVPIQKLPKASKQLIDVSCDVCGNSRKMQKKIYYKITKDNTEKYYCKNCKWIKTKETNLKNYGVENVFQNEDIKNKLKKTNLEKYGFERASKNEEIRKRITKSTKITKLRNAKLYFDKKDNIKIISSNDEIYEIECIKGHIYKIPQYILRNRILKKTEICTICNPVGSYTNSGYEIQLQNFIKENYSGIIELNDRKIICPNEIDIYLPDLKLGFELNGVYWHNELNKPNNYHLNKTELCEKQGIQLIHIYEDDWMYKQEIVKSRILNLLGKTPNKIYARKCIIKEITDNKVIREFLEKNHLQGFIGSEIKVGLYFNDELVSLMTFGKERKSMGSESKDGTYEMLRFCNKLNTSVIGGADKLFKYFISNYNPIEIVSYADRSWSRGGLYEKLGFTFIHKTKPDYYYVIDGIRKYRFNYRKDKLVHDGFDAAKSEHEIMLEREIYRIYDSGSLKYVWV